MSYQATLRRFILIISKIERYDHPSLEEIKESLQIKGLKVSTRTLERSIETLRDEFDVDIQYNKQKNGYKINKENSIGFSDFLGFLKHSYTSKYTVETLREGKEALKYIHFDTYSQIQGVQYIKAIHESIKNSQVVEITYKVQEEHKVYIQKVCPEFLKEHANRWYLIGHKYNTEDLVTYPLDNISKLTRSTLGFARKFGDAEETFNDVIGINITHKKPIDIVLSFSPFCARDVLNMPLHHSQKILENNKDEFKISIHVRPNFDLKQKIISYGSRVTVIKPIMLLKKL